MDYKRMTNTGLTLTDNGRKQEHVYTSELELKMNWSSQIFRRPKYRAPLTSSFKAYATLLPRSPNARL